MTATDQAASRAEELYRLLLQHVDVCRPCGAMEDCAKGTRLRRALRAARYAARERTPR
ncbi:hypothetical protein [Streptomyces sp. NPDC127108]|uniref:hypothetical protein n=1 Tax=Streptomyces sp. NPDC127108 TaxID=3345361 RepID=UPI003632EBC0